MININEHKFLIGASMVLAAALIIAGSAVYVVSNLRPQQIASYAQNQVTASSGRPTLPPGTPNPALSLPHSSVVNYVAGTVVSVSSSGFVIKNTQGGTQVAVVADSNTQVFMAGAQKDPQVYQQEMSVFLGKMQYASITDGIYEAPDPFVDIPFKLSNIKPGNGVSVMTDSAQQTASIHAVRIQILSTSTPAQ